MRLFLQLLSLWFLGNTVLSAEVVIIASGFYQDAYPIDKKFFRVCYLLNTPIHR